MCSPLVYDVVDIHTISPFIPSVAFGRVPFNPMDSILTNFALSILSLVLSPPTSNSAIDRFGPCDRFERGEWFRDGGFEAELSPRR